MDYSGWKSVRITRSIECIASGFELEVSDRWSDESKRWPVSHGDYCQVLIALDEVGPEIPPVITGQVDERSVNLGAEQHAVTVAGRDRTGMLVDSSAQAPWEYLSGIRLDDLARALLKPFGIPVQVDVWNLPRLPAKVAIDPGETAFEALARACRMLGVLPVSDGRGGVTVVRPGQLRATTALREGGANVATDDPGAPFHRHHRGPGDRPVAPRRTSPGLAPRGGVIGPRSTAAG